MKLNGNMGKEYKHSLCVGQRRKTTKKNSEWKNGEKNVQQKKGYDVLSTLYCVATN